MPVELNHTIIRSRDKVASATFLAGILGLEVSPPMGHFVPVNTSNGVSIDFDDAHGPIESQHFAFLLSEEEFDAAFARLEKSVADSGGTYWADPRHSRPGEINHNHGGRGVYFLDPDGHNMEMLTRPYGSGA